MREPKVKMGSIDFILFSTIMLLVAIGIVMVFSASSYIAFFKYKDSMYFLKRQLLSAVIGIMVMFFTIKLDYHWLKKVTGIIMILTVILLCLVFAFPATNGAKRWIYIGSQSIQPSEIAKYIVVLYLAKSIENKGERIQSFFYGIIPYFVVSGFYAALVLLEKNLSIASVIMIVTLIMIFVGGSKVSHLIGSIGTVGILGTIFILIEPYRLDRLKNFRNTWLD